MGCALQSAASSPVWASRLPLTQVLELLYSRFHRIAYPLDQRVALSKDEIHEVRSYGFCICVVLRNPGSRGRQRSTMCEQRWKGGRLYFQHIDPD